MQIKKIIIPVICVIVLGSLAGVIVYMNYKSNLYTIPGSEVMESEIRKLGYDVGEPEDPIENIGPRTYTGICAVEKGGANSAKNTVPEKKDLCYVAYDMEIKTDGKLENFIMNASSGNSLFEDPDVHYIYGGIYMDGKRIVSITTTDPKKAYEIGRTLGNLGLPKPR